MRDTLLLTVNEVAEQLRLGRPTVYRLIAMGEIPVVKIGRATRVAAADLERFVQRLRGDAGGDRPATGDGDGGGHGK